MSNSETPSGAGAPSVAAGWYPDPAGSPRSRWWDGTQWTEHFYDASTGVPVADLRAPEGTNVYTPWIWLVVFLPYLTLPFLFTIDFNGMFNGMDPNDSASATRAQLELFTSPGYLLLTLGSLLTTAGTVVFSYFDWRDLTRRGVPKPFHWGFGFLSLAGYPVYAIGRAVVTKRRTGHGSAVLWVTIGMIVLTMVVGLIWAGVIVTSIMQQIALDPSLYN